jgi:hypothetical protein
VGPDHKVPDADLLRAADGGFAVLYDRYVQRLLGWARARESAITRLT